VKEWQKGGILSFLLILFWFSTGIVLMSLLGVFEQERVAGFIDTFFMAPIAPVALVQQKLEIFFISPLLTSIFLWILVGALIGYLFGRHKGRFQ
jgi:predicted cobalt transporter CbtA